MSKNIGKSLWNIISTGGTILAYEAFIARRNSKIATEVNQDYIKTRLDKIDENVDILYNQNETVRKSVEIVIDKLSSEDARHKAINDIITEVNKVMDDKKKLIDYDFSQLIDKFNEFLSTLSMEQLCFVINITSSLFILSCVFSIFCAQCGNYLIDKFNLESKFPRLSKFIKLRVKFQHYYILINLLLITLTLFFIIHVNYLALTA
jgi:hypothetical protein